MAQVQEATFVEAPKFIHKRPLFKTTTTTSVHVSPNGLFFLFAFRSFYIKTYKSCTLQSSVLTHEQEESGVEVSQNRHVSTSLYVPVLCS